MLQKWQIGKHDGAIKWTLQQREWKHLCKEWGTLPAELLLASALEECQS